MTSVESLTPSERRDIFEPIPAARYDMASADDLAETAALDARVRDRIVAETRGNPLALLELPQEAQIGISSRNHLHRALGSDLGRVGPPRTTAVSDKSLARAKARRSAPS